ncbi:MAG: hypothetical protein ACK4MW_02890 [Aquificaceae bacterium]
MYVYAKKGMSKEKLLEFLNKDKWMIFLYAKELDLSKKLPPLNAALDYIHKNCLLVPVWDMDTWYKELPKNLKIRFLAYIYQKYAFQNVPKTSKTGYTNTKKRAYVRIPYGWYKELVQDFYSQSVEWALEFIEKSKKIIYSEIFHQNLPLVIETLTYPSSIRIPQSSFWILLKDRNKKLELIAAYIQENYQTLDFSFTGDYYKAYTPKQYMHPEKYFLRVISKGKDRLYILKSYQNLLMEVYKKFIPQEYRIKD